MSDKEEALEGTAQSGQTVAVSLKPISTADSSSYRLTGGASADEGLSAACQANVTLVPLHHQSVRFLHV